MIKRSLTINRHRTSVSLEPLFWERLQEVAKLHGLSVSGLVTEIDAQRSNDMASGLVRGGLSSEIRIFILRESLG